MKNNPHPDCRFAAHLLKAVADTCDRIFSLVGGMAIVVMAGATLTGIAFREIGVGGFGELELVQLFLAVAVLAPLAAAQAGGGHIGMTMITSRLKGRRLLAATLFQYLIWLAVCGIFLWKGIEASIDSIDFRETTAGALQAWPVWPFRLVFPLAMLLLILRIVQQLSYSLLSKGIDKPDRTIPESHSKPEPFL